MLKKMVLKKFENNKGVSIIMVIVVMLVISILAIAMIRLSYTERLQTIEDNKAVQARLNTDSGVQIMRAFAEKHSDLLKEKVDDQLNDAVTSKPFPFTTSLDKGSFETDLINENGITQLKITGLYMDKRKSARVELKKEKTTPDYLFPKFVTLTSELPDYSPVKVPETPITEPNLILPYNEQVWIDTWWGGYYKWVKSTSKTYDFTSNDAVFFNHMEVTSGCELKFDLHDEDRVMVVDTLTLHRGSYWSIINNNASQNMLVIYVTGQATIQAEFLNAHENLLIVLDKNARLYLDTQKLDGSQGIFNAYVYAPEGLVSLGSPGTFVSGAIITGTFINTTGYEGGEYVPPSRLTKYGGIISYPPTYTYQLGSTYDY